MKEISDPDRYRPDHCPQCDARQPLTGHGFYSRTLVDAAFDGLIRVRRYLCRLCKRTQTAMPYQRGQFWVRRFRKQAPALGVALATPVTASDFVARTLAMLESIGWIAAHRFLFSELRAHLLGWPASLAPQGRRATLPAAMPSA